jgi:hypothetical protein
VVIIDGCEHGLQVGGGKIRQCIKFPSGVRVKEVKLVEDSFGEKDPPAGTDFEEHSEKARYKPTLAGECSIETHDRYWVRASDGRVYRTWHPPKAIDVKTGQPCHFGHEHGDDPRNSPLYQWAGGVPFGIANHAAMVVNKHRHEDHFGHKVVVQNDWEAALGNPPDDGKPIFPLGFRCHWLSKVHQGTHSGDALGNNEHEYQNNTMCDDGAQRHPDPGWEADAGPDRHTEVSVKTLTLWGNPGEFLACNGLTPTAFPGEGTPLPPNFKELGVDSKREIKCAKISEGWLYKERPKEVVSETGHPDYIPADGGIDELWKPWSSVFVGGSQIFQSSAYYVVRNPARLYNPDGSLVAKRDVDGDGKVDDWIPTLEVCLSEGAKGLAACQGLPAFPGGDPTSWWRLPQSPFNGTFRVIHPKSLLLENASGQEHFCTDYLGKSQGVASLNGEGVPGCPAGQILQTVAATRNHWISGRAAWGPQKLKLQDKGITGSTVNSKKVGEQVIGSGYGHEWVRFFQAEGVHAPN